SGKALKWLPLPLPPHCPRQPEAGRAPQQPPGSKLARHGTGGAALLVRLRRHRRDTCMSSDGTGTKIKEGPD
ncbi:unnamed protein product, partial [Urochloa humidicola]